MKKGRTNLTLNIDAEVKEEAEKVLSELGVRTGDAVEMFFRQVIMQGGLPFKVKLPRVRKRLIPAIDYISDSLGDKYAEPAEAEAVRTEKGAGAEDYGADSEKADSAEAADAEVFSPKENEAAETKKPAETEKAKPKGKKITSKATLVIKEPKKPEPEPESGEEDAQKAGSSEQNGNSGIAEGQAEDTDAARGDVAGLKADAGPDAKEEFAAEDASAATAVRPENGQADESGATAPAQGTEATQTEAYTPAQSAQIAQNEANAPMQGSQAPSNISGEASTAGEASSVQAAEALSAATEAAMQAEATAAVHQEKPRIPSIIELRRDVETGLYKISVFIHDNEEEDGKAWIGDLMIGDEHQNVGKLSSITREDGTIDTDEFRFSKDVSYVEHSYARKYMYTDSAPMTAREMVDAACDFLHEKGVEAISYFSASNSDRSKMEEIGFSYMGKSQSGLLPVNQYVR